MLIFYNGIIILATSAYALEIPAPSRNWFCWFVFLWSANCLAFFISLVQKGLAVVQGSSTDAGSSRRYWNLPPAAHPESQWWSAGLSDVEVPNGFEDLNSFSSSCLLCVSRVVRLIWSWNHNYCTGLHDGPTFHKYKNLACEWHSDAVFVCESD